MTGPQGSGILTSMARANALLIVPAELQTVPVGIELQAIILAGGKGERLRPYTEDRPKPMVLVLEKPILEYQVRWLASQGMSTGRGAALAAACGRTAPHTAAATNATCAPNATAPLRANRRRAPESRDSMSLSNMRSSPDEKVSSTLSTEICGVMGG